MPMEKNKKPLSQILYLLLYFFMVYCISEVSSRSMYVPFHTGLKLVIIFALSGGTALFFRKPLWLLVLSFLGAMGLYWMRLYREFLFLKGSFKFRGLLENLQQFFLGKAQISMGNGAIVWVICVLLLCVFTYGVIFKFRKSVLLLPVYVGVMGYCWYIFIDEAYLYLALFIFAFLILISMESYFGLKHQTKKDKSYWLWLKMAVIYGLIITLGAGFVPFHGKLIETQRLPRFLSEKFPQLKNFRDDITYSRSFGRAEDFDFANTGFQQGDGPLGGPVTLSDELVMRVRASSAHYLRGNVKVKYEKDRWLKGKESWIALRNYQEIAPEILGGQEERLKITYENMATPVIFNPYQTLSIQGEKESKAYYDENYNFTFPKALYKNESYQLKMIKSNPPISQSVKALSPYEIEIYTDPGPFISGDVRALNERICRQSTTDYEKAWAIQTHLRNHFKYNLQVPYTPSNRPFLDYFLFELKEGYCTYYATAMTLMLRLNKIPARYVEGFLMQEEGEEGTYLVRKRHAHAWVEAYILPYGWLTFEPTPAYDMPSQWQEEKKEGKDREDRDKEDLALLEQNQRDRERKQIEEMEQSQALDGDAQKEVGIFAVIMKYLPPLFMVLIVFSLLLRVFYLKKEYEKAERKARKRPLSGQIIFYYTLSLALLERMGYPRKGFETPKEYAERVSVQIYDGKHSLVELAQYFTQAFYGGVAPSAEQVAQGEAFARWAEKRCKNVLGKTRFLYLKYIRGGFYDLEA